MNADAEPKRLSCAEAARYLDVTERQLERMRYERTGPPFFRPPGMRPFYIESDLRDYIDRARTPRKSPQPRNESCDARAVGTSIGVRQWKRT